MVLGQLTVSVWRDGRRVVAIAIPDVDIEDIAVEVVREAAGEPTGLLLKARLQAMDSQSSAAMRRIEIIHVWKVFSGLTSRIHWICLAISSKGMSISSLVSLHT